MEWGERILDEFHQQAEKEKAMGYPTAPFMQNLEHQNTRYKVQINFTNFVLMPLWKPVAAVFPRLEVSTSALPYRL